MKCDVVIYSKTAAVGLFWFAGWYNEPSVMFVYEACEYKNNDSEEWTKKSLAEIKSFGEVCEENEDLVIRLMKRASEGDLIPVDLYKDFVSLFVKVLNKVKGNKDDYFNKRKIIYTDLIKYCQENMVWCIIHNLEKSKTENDKVAAFQYAKYWAEEYDDACAYQQLAYYCYYGIGVEKSYKKVFLFMKKAAELGNEYAIRWLERNDDEDEE